MYVLTTSGHGDLVRGPRTHTSGPTAGRTYATVRTASGGWFSGEVLRTWESREAAMRDNVSPEQRYQAYWRREDQRRTEARAIEQQRRILDDHRDAVIEGRA